MNISAKWTLRVMPRRMAWLIFAAGIITGFGLTVLVNIFAKLAVTAAALFSAGYLAGRFCSRRSSRPFLCFIGPLMAPWT